MAGVFTSVCPALWSKVEHTSGAGLRAQGVDFMVQGV